MDASDVCRLTDTAHRRGLPVFAHPTDMAGLNAVVEIGADILAHAALLSGDWDSDKASVFAARGLGLTPALRLFELFSHPSTPVDLAIWQAAALHEAGSDIRFGAGVWSARGIRLDEPIHGLAGNPRVNDYQTLPAPW